MTFIPRSELARVADQIARKILAEWIAEQEAAARPRPTLVWTNDKPAETGESEPAP